MKRPNPHGAAGAAGCAGQGAGPPSVAAAAPSPRGAHGLSGCCLRRGRVPPGRPAARAQTTLSPFAARAQARVVGAHMVATPSIIGCTGLGGGRKPPGSPCSKTERAPHPPVQRVKPSCICAFKLARLPFLKENHRRTDFAPPPPPLPWRRRRPQHPVTLALSYKNNRWMRASRMSESGASCMHSDGWQTHGKSVPMRRARRTRPRYRLIPNSNAS